MKIIVLSVAMFIALSGTAQFLQDNVSGKPYLAKSNDEYEGSPLLFQAWVKAQVKTATGKVYNNMLVNIDLLQDLPLFFNNNRVYTFTEDVQSFTIGDSTGQLHFRRGKALHPELPDVLVELMADTPLVIKKYNKKVVEIPSYGTTGKHYRYTDGKSYYWIKKGELKKISLSKDSAEDVFDKKWKALEAWAKQADISFKTEEGWRELIRKYKSLP